MIGRLLWGTGGGGPCVSRINVTAAINSEGTQITERESAQKGPSVSPSSSRRSGLFSEITLKAVSQPPTPDPPTAA